MFLFFKTFPTWPGIYIEISRSLHYLFARSLQAQPGPPATQSVCCKQLYPVINVKRANVIVWHLLSMNNIFWMSTRAFLEFFYLLCHCHHIPEARVDWRGSVAGGGLDVLRGGGGGALDALARLPELGGCRLFLLPGGLGRGLLLCGDRSRCCFLLSNGWKWLLISNYSSQETDQLITI